MSQAANVSNGEATGKKKRKPKHAPEGFLRSVELKKLVYFILLPALTVAAAVFVFLVVSSVEKERAADQVADLQMHADFSKAPLPLTKEVTILTHDIDDIEWSDTEGFIDSIIMRSRPVRVRNSPVHSWAINEWDLTEVARKGLMLNGSRLQSSPVFVLGHERDKGGMIGSESDLEVSYVNAYLKDFLNAVFDKDTYLYWTGPCSIFETFLSSMNDGSGIAKAASIGPWEALRVAESSINISLEDSSLWTPMLWLSHPGVTAHTHYDTQHNFFAHIMGRKKMLIFELASELYPYPNVHRSYRQSQVRLEEASTTAPAKHRNVGRKTIAERFPRSKRLNAYELTVTPGDLLYIPPFWAHRVESETLALSVSVLSPSSTEVALAEAYWVRVPFGPFESGDAVFKSGAVKLLLYYLVGLGDVLLDLSLETFASDLLHSRYYDLYPLHVLKMLKTEMGFQCPSMADEKLTQLLEEHAQKFYDAALEVATIVNELNVHRSIKETFYRDYAEQVIRWAVGPEGVPVFLKFCLK